MKLIPYPSYIKPARLTSQLARSDELFQSPVTGIQQTATRGNAYWRWSIEYRDLSDNERDIVQAFLMKCQGSLNTFKIPDFGNYEIRGAASDWIDMFEDTGDFRDQPDVDSYSYSVNISRTLLDGDGLRNEIRNVTSGNYISKANVVSLEAGKTYGMRAKLFNNNFPMAARFVVGSNFDMLMTTGITSDGQLSAPFFADVGSAKNISVYVDAGGKVGDYFDIHNYRLSQVAVVSNSENLLTRSNNFAHADWTAGLQTNASSGYGDSPTGVTSGAWKLYGDNVVNSQYVILHNYTKPTTEDIYCVSVYARAVELAEMQLQIDNGGASHAASVLFWLASGTHEPVTLAGSFSNAHAFIFDVGSGWYKCALAVKVSSHNNNRTSVWVASGTGIQFTNNGSDGIEIFGAQLRNSPYSGHYVPTSDTIIPGSGWQTGSNLYIEGLDPDTVMFKSGARFELITKYHDVASGTYERSEFKRLTSDLKAHREGWGIASFDPPIRNAPEAFRAAKVSGTNFLGETIPNVLVFDRPELKARLVGSTIQYIEKPLRLTDIVFDVIEDLAE